MVRGAFEGDAGHDEAPQGIGQGAPLGVQDGEVKKAGAPRRGRRAAAALPGVEPDVVMVAAGADEGRGRAHLLHQLETEDATVEPEGPVEIGDLQMDVPDADPRIERSRL
jgi:hypothetical protein